MLIFIGRRLDLSKARLLSRYISSTTRAEDIQTEQEFSSHGEVFEITDRGLPRTSQQWHAQRQIPVIQPDNPRLLKVTLIGEPNAGKSTLLNKLVGIRISPVSQKVHTTRHKIMGVLVRNNIQIQFLDTPGIVTREHCLKHDLEHTFITDIPTSCKDADKIGVIVDVSNSARRHALNPGILKLLRNSMNKETFLVLNKIDALESKRKLLEITTALTCGVVNQTRSIEPIKYVTSKKPKLSMEKLFKKTEAILNSEPKPDDEIDYGDGKGWPHFERVFMISAKDGDGVTDIEKYLLDSAKKSPWIHPQQVVTDLDPKELINSTIRESLLNHMHMEIGYRAKISIVDWTWDDVGTMTLAAQISAPERQIKMIVGKNGQTIQKIVREVRTALQQSFQCELILKLIVKARRS